MAHVTLIIITEPDAPASEFAPADYCQALEASGHTVELVARPGSSRSGAAFAGLAAAGGDLLVVLDPAMCYEPADLPRVVEALQSSDAEVAVASRLTPQSGPFRAAVGMLVRWWTGSTDPLTGLIALTRSAYAGQQRFAAATWSGDIAARWHDMKTQIAAGLNFSLSGLPYWTMDIGGFSTERRFQEPSPEDLEEWREMLTRWYQFGAFCPLFRSHGEYPYREIYLIAPESHPAYRSIADVIHLRYRLMPYIYSLAGMVTHEDGTIMRALVMDFDDPAVREINDQYMFGPALLINPVTEFGARTRLVYLPSGSGWYDFYTGAYAPGGRAIEAAAPYEKMPIFVKAGTILPTGPALQYSDEKPADPLRLFVFAGADGQFKLYEDENVNYDYEKGEFAVIPMRWDEAKKTLTIGPRRGRFDGMLKRRTIEIVKIDPKTGRGVDFDAAPDKVIVYDGKKQTIKFR